VPLSQIPILGALVPLGTLGSPQWNPKSNPLFGNALQSGSEISTDQCGKTGNAFDSPCQILIPSSGPSLLAKVWSGFKTVASFEAGYLDEIIPAMRYGRRFGQWATGVHVVDEDSTAYKSGGWVMFGVQFVAGAFEAKAAASSFRLAGSVALDSAPHYFPRLGARYRHLQLDLWRAGVKNRNFITKRIPLSVRLSRRRQWKWYFKF